jgi:hypothetical protein
LSTSHFEKLNSLTIRTPKDFVKLNL